MVCAQISNKTFPWLSVKAKNVRVQVRLLEHLHALILSLSLSYALSLSHCFSLSRFVLIGSKKFVQVKLKSIAKIFNLSNLLLNDEHIGQRVCILVIVLHLY